MAFTYSWQTVNASQVDADSPVNETLMDSLRQDLTHLREWVGKDYFAGAAENHNHNGTNSALPAANTISQSQMADSAIGQAELKTSTSETSGKGGAPATVSITTSYAFGVLLKGSHSGDYYNVIDGDMFEAETSSLAVLTLPTSYTRRYSLFSSSGSYTAYLYYRYVAACPPYDLGDGDPWWFFLWLLRDKSSGKIFSAHCADDPPWHFGMDDLPKDDPERIYHKPHPWYLDYPDPSMLDEKGLEVVLVDLRELNELADQPTRESIQAARMVARRDERVAILGLPLALSEEQKALDAAAAKPTKKCRGIEAARLRADLAGRGLLELVHAEAQPESAQEIKIVAAAQATKEIAKAQRDRLPIVPVGKDSKTPWRDLVKVLKA